jgi:ParB-like chromosome segregation protein Spo0J
MEYIAEQLRPLAVPIGSVNHDAANARKHGEKNMAAIVASLTRFGQRAPIVVQRKGMVVRAGNGRLAAAKSLGWSHIAAVVVDDESVEAVAFAIADNRTAELAEWDQETLASLLNTMGEEDLASTGFDQADLSGLLAGLTPAVAPESSAMEIDAEAFSGAHKCPKCGFEYD